MNFDKMIEQEPINHEKTSSEELSLFLENRFLRITLNLLEGGRVDSIFDKRSQKNLGNSAASFLDAENKKPSLIHSFEISCFFVPTSQMADPALRKQANENLHSQFPFKVQVYKNSELEALLYRFDFKHQIDHYIKISLPENGAKIEFKSRIFNRSLLPLEITTGLQIRFEDQDFQKAQVFHSNHCGVYFEEIDFGLGLEGSGGFPACAQIENTTLKFFNDPFASTILGPRQSHTWQMSLTPLTGLPHLGYGENGIYGSLKEEQLYLLSNIQHVETTLFIKTEDQQVFECPLALYPERVHKVSLSKLSKEVIHIQIRDRSKEIIFDYDLIEKPKNLQNHSFAPKLHSMSSACFLEAKYTMMSTAMDMDFATSSLRSLEELYYKMYCCVLFGSHKEALKESDFSFHILESMDALKSSVMTLKAYQKFRDRDYRAAADFLEEALLFNAEDPINWCLKAIAERKFGCDPKEESSELLNAFYLAPKELLHRAESMLSQPVQAGDKPMSILNPFVQTPDCFIEVASNLIEAGLFDEATRSVQESLKLCSDGRLFLLLAFLYLCAKNLDIEAANQIHFAREHEEDFSVFGCYIEQVAVNCLSERFPKDLFLQKLCLLLKER